MTNAIVLTPPPRFHLFSVVGTTRATKAQNVHKPYFHSNPWPSGSASVLQSMYCQIENQNFNITIDKGGSEKIYKENEIEMM